MTPRIVALDLFAGTGWGVACQRLGVEEYGVEIMPEARAIRAANGMRTIYSDVWDGLAEDAAKVDALLAEREEHQATEAARLLAEGWTFAEVYDLLIASPPCQSFSMAGKGAGRKALDDVLEAIETRAYLDADRLREFAAGHGDDRIALVLTPLAHVARDTPTYVVFEQVPPVLPVWERCAEEMRRWGYSVWTGNLQAEMYGVPQTRKRAILIARADGKEAKAPTPTHSRYYSRDPQRLDDGVPPWVSMAEALGWGMTERPFITAGNAVGRAEGVGGSGAKAAINREKNHGEWIERGEVEQVRTGMGKGMIERHGDRSGRDVLDPAFTVLGGDGGNSQPGFGIAMRSNYSAGGPTVTGGGAATGGAEVFGRHGRAVIEEMVGDGPRETTIDPDLPSPTVAGDPRIPERGWREPHEKQMERATRVSVEEAAALQSYPADFIWDAEFVDPKTGRTKPITKTNKFLQVGNAVPPRLAEAILREVLS